MFVQPLPADYANTISTLGQPQPQPPPEQPPLAPSIDDLPAHPIIQQYLLNSASSLPPPDLSSATAAESSTSLLSAAPLAPPKPSDFFTHPNQERPYFLFCLSCSTPLSDVFHVTDGDDAHVTVDAVYSDSVLSATAPTVLPQQGLFYALSCHRCGSHIGRYYRFTSPTAINKCNRFSLDVQCVGVRLLGSATVKGEQYAEETGIATRLTQVMLTTAAVREEMDEAKVEGARMRDERDRARARLKRMEQRLRRLMGDEYGDDDGDAAEANARSAVALAAHSSTAASAADTTLSTASPSQAAIARGAQPPTTPTTQSASAAKKRGRPRKSAVADKAEEVAHVPVVKRKEKAEAAKAVTAAAGRDETEHELDEGEQGRRPHSATNGAKRGKPR